VAKLWKYTSIGPSDKSLFVHNAIHTIHTPFPIISSRKFYWKIPVQYYNQNVYLRLCALLFQFSVNWSSDMQFGVKNLEKGASIQPDAANWSLELYCCCF